MSVNDGDSSLARSSVLAGKLWAGGLATAVVAALVAVVGILISRGILDIPVLAPDTHGAWGSANTASYALAAAVIALAATGLMHLLLLTTPTPDRFFGWIMALAIVVAVALPLGLIAGLAERLATGVINLVIGMAITFLVIGVSGSARRAAAAKYGYTTGGYGQPGQPGQPGYPRQPGHPGPGPA